MELYNNSIDICALQKKGINYILTHSGIEKHKREMKGVVIAIHSKIT